MLRMIVTTIYTANNAIAMRYSPWIAVMTAQGIMMPPVPSTGRISNIAISNAITTAFSMPITDRPMDSSTKVIDIMIAYDRIQTNSVPVTYSLISQNTSCAFSLSCRTKNEAIRS